jgi:hypothetical protein
MENAHTKKIKPGIRRRMAIANVSKELTMQLLSIFIPKGNFIGILFLKE